MNKKKALAIVLAATMTMGSSMAAFAADTGSGTTTGTGTNEGHVDKEVINVVLPTVDAGSSPFSYITDPERLIQATAGARYEDFTFPEAESDTGVYFQVGDKEYANTSQTLKVINKSSANVKVTVDVTAKTPDSGTALALATDGESGLKDDTPLFLNLKVGQENKAVTAIDTKVTVEKVIGGTEDNFEVTYDADGGYKYVPKADANKWNALEISMNGKVFKKTVDANAAAPKLEVTWAYEKDTTTAVDTSDQVEYVDGPSISINKNDGTITISNYDGTKWKSMTLNDGEKDWPITSGKDGSWVGGWQDDASVDKVFQLGSNWYPEYLKGRTVYVTLTSTEGDPIKSASVTFPAG